MQKFTTIWFSDEQGPKTFYTNKSRVQIHETSLSMFKEFGKLIGNDLDLSGIYILVGSGEDQIEKVYIGETGSFKNRIYDHLHDEGKAFAERIFMISSKDRIETFSKTELHYLERKLITKLESSNYKVVNGNTGQGREPVQIEKIGLDEELVLIYTGLKSLGMNLEKETVVTVKPDNYISDRESISIKTKVSNSDTYMNGVLNPDNTITVNAGQSFENKTRVNMDDRKLVVKELAKAKSNPDLEVTGDIEGYSIRYINDVTYTSPTASAYLMNGGHTSGWSVWKEEDSKERIMKYKGL